MLNDEYFKPMEIINFCSSKCFFDGIFGFYDNLPLIIDSLALSVDVRMENLLSLFKTNVKEICKYILHFYDLEK